VVTKKENGALLSRKELKKARVKGKVMYKAKNGFKLALNSLCSKRVCTVLFWSLLHKVGLETWKLFIFVAKWESSLRSPFSLSINKYPTCFLYPMCGNNIANKQRLLWSWNFPRVSFKPFLLLCFSLRVWSGYYLATALSKWGWYYLK